MIESKGEMLVGVPRVQTLGTRTKSVKTDWLPNIRVVDLKIHG
jgi:hypothetical protein